MASIKFACVWAALAAASALTTAGAAHANLLTNGSFEDLTHFVPNGDDTMEVFAGDATTMPGWTVFHTDISWIGPTNPFSGATASPGGGDYFLDLSGYHNGDPTGGIQQTVATVAGASYLLTFALQSDPVYGIQDGVHVSAGDTSADFATTNDGTQRNFWEAESFSFVATGASTTISILGNLGQNAVGVDNFVLTGEAGGVPEPAAWALMLLGFAALGAALRSARRTAARTA